MTAEEIFKDKKKMFELVCSHYMCDAIKPGMTKEQEEKICLECIENELDFSEIPTVGHIDSDGHTVLPAEERD